MTPPPVRMKKVSSSSSLYAHRLKRVSSQLSSDLMHPSKTQKLQKSLMQQVSDEKRKHPQNNSFQSHAGKRSTECVPDAFDRSSEKIVSTLD